MSQDADPKPLAVTTSVQVPVEIVKLFYRLQQLPNMLVLMETNDKGEPVKVVPLARVETLSRNAQ